MSINDKGCKKVKNGIDENGHEEGEEGLAEHVDKYIIGYVECHKRVVQIISIHHGEQGVE